MSQENLLEVKHLRTEFFSSKKSSVTAVDDVNFEIKKGEIVGLVGESGCGKSVTSLSIMQLLKDTPGKVTNGEIIFQGRNLLEASKKEMLDIRGDKMSMIFQEPMSSLNPSMRIDKQMIEGIRLHTSLSKADARKRAADILAQVGIPDPERVLKNYPHQLSGGMSQRVMIAMAMSCEPDLLIADEPTTALDVTIQAQILELMRKIQQDKGMSILLITHDLGVVANIADRVAVLYAGQIVELGTVEDVFYDPRHPYTWALLSSLPQLAERNTTLFSITGTPPSLYNDIVGDAFAPRNQYCMKIDTLKEPPMFKVSDTHYAKTWLLDPRAPKVEKPEAIRNIHEKLVNAFNI